MALGFILLPVVLAGADLSASRGGSDVQQQYERWERRLRARVTELHVVPAAAKKDSTCDVVISFAIGRDERPADAAIRKSSCKSFYDRAAYRLVGSLGRVGRVPSMTGTEHRVVLKLTYGNASTAAADQDLTDALLAERQTYSRRNLEIVTTAANRASDASQLGPES